jgi:hypothetical protein
VTAIERFWSKVSPEPMSGCWLWTGGTSANGYGRFSISGRLVQAHRYSYQLSGRTIPKGLELDHLCRVRACVNTSHLEPVTRSENTKRGIGGALRTEAALARTHCERSHELTRANTRIEMRNGATRRRCRTCNRMSEKRRVRPK